MITLNASGGSITFTFDGNSTYLNDGTITVPVNSLALIIDESDMATFRKAASNDIFVSANIAEFGMTKDELIAWYKENMVSSGGGGGGVTPEEVEEMIDEAISGITVSGVTEEELNEAIASAKTEIEAEIPTVPTSNTAFTNDAGYITSGEVQTQIDNSISGKVDTSTYTAYTAATDATLSGKADTATTYTKTEVDNAITAATSTKQDTLIAGDNITISGNVISATGGGGGGMTEDDELLLATALTDLNDRKIDASEVKSNYQKKGDYATKTYVTTALEPYETKLDEINTEEVAAYALNELNERLIALETAVQALQALHNNE